MERIFVKPAEGSRVKDPLTFELMPERGKSVPANSYWLRRIKDGTVVIANKIEVPNKKKKSTTKKKSSEDTDELEYSNRETYSGMEAEL
jgi:hypothetical protein